MADDARRRGPGGRRRMIREYGLTAGTLGSTAGQTIMVALLPVLLAEHARSAIWIGFVIGGEGLFALLVPYWIGHMSDHLSPRWVRRVGRRSFFLIAMAPIMAGALAVTPFLDGYWTLAGIALVFFAAFHGYLTPLWALMVDAVPDRRRGRVHGVRGALHAAGLGYGLVVGGLLFSAWEPLPFLTGGLLIGVTTWLTVAAVSGRRAEAGTADRWSAGPDDTAGSGTERLSDGEAAPEVTDTAAADRSENGPPRSVWRVLVGRRDIRWFLIANALWTGAVDGIRPYVFPFALVVLGISVGETSLVLLLLLAGIGIGTVVIGRLGDRYGRARLLEMGALITAVALSLGILVRDVTGAVLLLLAAGLGAAALIALPYPIFASLLGDRAIGRFTGVYVLSMGAARVVSPVLVGAAIDLGALALPEIDGYPFMWPIAGIMALASVAALRVAIAASPTLPTRDRNST